MLQLLAIPTAGTAATPIATTATTATAQKGIPHDSHD